MGYVFGARGKTPTPAATVISQGRFSAGGTGGSLSAFWHRPCYRSSRRAKRFLNQGGNWTNSFTISGVGSTESNGLGRNPHGEWGATSAVRFTLAGHRGNLCRVQRQLGSAEQNYWPGRPNDWSWQLYQRATARSRWAPRPPTRMIIRATRQSTTPETHTANNDTLTFTAGSNNIMPNGSAAVPSPGNVIIVGTGTSSGIFDLAGTNQSINGLASSGTAANTKVQNGTVGTSTLDPGGTTMQRLRLPGSFRMDLLRRPQ